MTEAELVQIEQRVAAATAGPWENHWKRQEGEDQEVTVARDGYTTGMDGLVVGLMYYDGWHAACGVTDAEFIAHARQDVPALVAEVRRLQAENAELEREAAESSRVPMPWNTLPGPTPEQWQAIERKWRGEEPW